MTEDKAKTKWCPMVRLSNETQTGSANRDFYGSFDTDSMCLASECMMWQWSLTPKDANGASSMECVVLPEGYCGLAGKL